MKNTSILKSTICLISKLENTYRKTHFREEPYFIEVGSADGTSYSNTFLLEKRYNWKGICIEANPDFYEELKFVRSAVCIQKCISSNQDNMLFLKDSVCGHVLSEAPEKNSENVITVSTCSLEQVLIEQNAPNVIDYLSIDVEGHEDAVLLNFPFDNYLFNSITIERPSEALRSHLKHHGYIIIKEIIDLDVFYIHETFLKSHCKNLFSYWAKCAK